MDLPCAKQGPSCESKDSKEGGLRQLSTNTGFDDDFQQISPHKIGKKEARSVDSRQFTRRGKNLSPAIQLPGHGGNNRLSSWIREIFRVATGAAAGAS